MNLHIRVRLQADSTAVFKHSEVVLLLGKTVQRSKPKYFAAITSLIKVKRLKTNLLSQNTYQQPKAFPWAARDIKVWAESHV